MWEDSAGWIRPWRRWGYGWRGWGKGWGGERRGGLASWPLSTFPAHSVETTCRQQWRKWSHSPSERRAELECQTAVLDHYQSDAMRKHIEKGRHLFMSWHQSYSFVYTVPTLVYITYSDNYRNWLNHFHDKIYIDLLYNISVLIKIIVFPDIALYIEEPHGPHSFCPDKERDRSPWHNCAFVISISG